MFKIVKYVQIGIKYIQIVLIYVQKIEFMFVIVRFYVRDLISSFFLCIIILHFFVSHAKINKITLLSRFEVSANFIFL
jgi:hypothetical protein